MFTPPVPQNLPQRIQCHLLRGRSLRKLEMMTEALMDFNEACKLDPKDKSIGTNSNNRNKYACQIRCAAKTVTLLLTIQS